MVIKSYGGSALSFFLSVVPTPDETFFSEYNDIMKYFLWDSRSTKIKIETLYKDYEEGGIRLLDLKAFDQSLKLKWLKYLQIKNDNSEVTTKLSQYADDTTLFLDGQPQSIIAVLQLCKEFEQISSLKINESKTKAACVGNLYYQYDGMKSKFTKLD